MEPTEVVKQTIEFYKTSFNDSFKAMLMLQDQAQKMFDIQLDQVPGLPDETKKAVKEWIESYNKGCIDFKNMVDENFNRVDSYFSVGEKS